MQENTAVRHAFKYRTIGQDLATKCIHEPGKMRPPLKPTRPSRPNDRPDRARCFFSAMGKKASTACPELVDGAVGLSPGSTTSYQKSFADQIQQISS